MEKHSPIGTNSPGQVKVIMFSCVGRCIWFSQYKWFYRAIFHLNLILIGTWISAALCTDKRNAWRTLTSFSYWISSIARELPRSCITDSACFRSSSLFTVRWKRNYPWVLCSASWRIERYPTHVLATAVVLTLLLLEVSCWTVVIHSYNHRNILAIESGVAWSVSLNPTH